MSRTANINPAACLIALEDNPSGALLAASVRDILLRIPDVCAVTGLSIPTIYRLMTRGEFPRPLKITRAARAWRLSEITAWIDSRDRENSWPGDGPNGRARNTEGLLSDLEIRTRYGLSDKDWVGRAENGRLLSAVRTERDRRITRRPRNEGRKR